METSHQYWNFYSRSFQPFYLFITSAVLKDTANGTGINSPLVFMNKQEAMDEIRENERMLYW